MSPILFIIGLICLIVSAIRMGERSFSYGRARNPTWLDWVIAAFALLCPLSWALCAVFGLVWLAERAGDKS